MGLSPRIRIVLITIGLLIIAFDILDHGLSFLAFLALFFFLLPGFFGGVGSRSGR